MECCKDWHKCGHDDEPRRPKLIEGDRDGRWQHWQNVSFNGQLILKTYKSLN